MKNVSAIQFTCITNSDFNCRIEKNDIVAELHDLKMSNVDWIEYAIEHVIYDNGLSESDFAFICSEKCLSVLISNESTGDIIKITKLF